MIQAMVVVFMFMESTDCKGGSHLERHSSVNLEATSPAIGAECQLICHHEYDEQATLYLEKDEKVLALRWHDNNQVRHQVFNPIKYKFNHDGSMIIRNFNRGDFGHYRCFVETPDGSVVSNENVILPTQEFITATAGQNLTLNCNNPYNHTVTWFKDYLPYFQGKHSFRKLLIVNFESSQQGEYTCRIDGVPVNRYVIISESISARSWSGTAGISTAAVLTILVLGLCLTAILVQRSLPGTLKKFLKSETAEK